MPPTPFTVAGMASTSNAHHNHNPNLNNWAGTSTGGPLSTSFTDTLTQSRSHYQSGYLMSASQSNNSPTGAQRVDEAPVVQTKAKMNHAFSRGPASDFGMDSMFQSTRQRQTLADEDAPPMMSVNDIPTEKYADMSSSQFQPRGSTLNSSFARARPKPSPTAQSSPSTMLYIIVFGYPSDKYSLTVEFFKSLGDASDPDPHADILNCFKIGYKDPADAMRAVRKNGEVLGGSWMVGAKWADAAQAEALLSQPVRHSSPFDADMSAMAVDSPSPTPGTGPAASTSAFGATFGTPIKLAPSASAFRRGAGGSASSAPKPAAAAPQTPSWASAASVPPPDAASAPGTPGGKGMLGQVSEMIFGW
ncbi:hypothetical protein FB45DRAFT_835990 [Roridomyces roridus]|uniref:RRM Nup35-type domain-containing protein n=1 Tax=Roridomyces roridus TaxID=1738132 RepID=A0AAD7BN83_9AGAR|nr:hypothetical protein FB45DRAFT_835990 [Roridomyces roridus]